MRPSGIPALVVALLVATAAAAEKPRLAVMELAAKSGIKQEQLDVLGDMLATEIRMIGVHDVITKSDIQAMIGLERSKELLSCDDASCMAEIGGALGVELMVTGNVGRFGQVYAVNLKLINVKKAKVENSIFRKVAGGEQALLEDFALAVRVLLGVAAAAPRPTVAPQPAGGTGGPTQVVDQSHMLSELGFSAEQVGLIRSARIRVTSDTVLASRRLLKREYTTEDLTAFVLEHRLANRDAREAEQYVLYHTAGLEARDFMRFYKRIRKRDLTEYYNDATESGALSAMKWVCFGLGVAAAPIGGLTFFMGDTLDDDTTVLAGIGLMAVGVGLFVTSVVLMIIDGVNIGNLPDRFFDKATKSQILEAVGDGGRKSAGLTAPGPAFTISPLVDEQGRAGLALGFRF